jgi:hypothetical protein
MSVEFSILEDGYVVRYGLSDPWTYEEYEEALESDVAHRESVNHKVHNLLIAKVRTVPAGVLKARGAPAFTHRTAGQLAIVGTNQIVRAFSEAVMRLAHFDRAKFFDTEDQALDYLRGIIQTEDQSAKNGS